MRYLPPLVASPEQGRRVTRHAPAPYSTIKPPTPGTRVIRNGRPAVVQKYRPGHPLNLFPIAFTDGSQLWEMVGVDDVQIVRRTAAKRTAA